MAIDFSQLDASPAHTGKVDFSALGAIPAVGTEETPEETTALGAAGRGAVGMVPLGTQAYAALAGTAENKPYLQERQELEKEIQADIESHPVARLAGQAAGVAAPALLTGGSSIPATLGEAAGQGAAIGAGFGAGNAIDTLAGGGSGLKAAGDVALGAGLGAVGGTIGQKIGQVLGKAAPKLEEFAARKAAQGVGMGSEELGNMTQQELLNTGKMLMDKSVVRPGASTQEMFDTAKTLHEQYGDQIGQIGGQSRELGLTTDVKPLLDSLDSKYQAASQLQNPDELRNALFYKKGIADILAMARQNLPEGSLDMAQTLAKSREDFPAGAFAASRGPVPSEITFDQLQRLKKSYGNSAFINGTVKNPAAADVYSALGSGQKAIAEKIADNPNAPAELQDAMANYSKLYPVVDGLQDVLGRERAGNLPAKGFGMIGKLVGQLPGQKVPAINALTSLGLLGAGHPLWAVGAATATLQNPRAMAGIAQSAAAAIPKITGALPVAGAQLAAPTSINVNHPALAPWKPIFDRNAASAKDAGELQKSQAITDFVLSQRDPAYAAAKQKTTDEPIQKSTAKMAEGGVVQESGITEPLPQLGSTLEGLASELKNPTHEKKPVPMEDLPANTTQRFHQPFNPDLAEKLKAFMADQKEKDNVQP